MWEKGDIQELLKEGKIIQRQLQGTRSRKDDKEETKTACRFSKLLMEGTVRAALRYLSKREQTGLLSLDKIMTEDTLGATYFGCTVYMYREPSHFRIIPYTTKFNTAIYTRASCSLGCALHTCTDDTVQMNTAEVQIVI